MDMSFTFRIVFRNNTFVGKFLVMEKEKSNRDRGWVFKVKILVTERLFRFVWHVWIQVNDPCFKFLKYILINILVNCLSWNNKFCGWFLFCQNNNQRWYNLRFAHSIFLWSWKEGRKRCADLSPGKLFLKVLFYTSKYR